MAMDFSRNVIIPLLELKTVVCFDIKINGGSSELGVQMLPKLKISASTYPPPSSSTKDDQYKTYADYVEDMILRNFPGVTEFPQIIPPTIRRLFVDFILNEPLYNARQRFVSRRWPHPKAIENSKIPPGKMAPNGVQLWGSTLLDFYSIENIPGLSDQRTISTSSKLLEWCKANNEDKNGVANQCIAWAEEEKDPEVVPVYNTANLIRSLENSALSEQQGSKEDADARTLPQPFDPAGYPGPWADTAPFSTSGPWCFNNLPVLEEYIPQSRLPKKLIVHDPGHVLSALGPLAATQEDPGRIFEYELRLSDKPKHSKRREDDEADRLKRETNDKQVLDNFLANPHSSTTRPPGLEVRDPCGGPINVATKPAIYVVLPPCPPLATVNKAHLYLSPIKCVGAGNHSYVYNAEWELPRSCLVEELICTDCVMEDLRAILREEDGENGETRDRKWDELSGKMVSKETSTPQHLITDGATYVIREGQKSTEVVYEGPYRVIRSRVKYQNPARAPYCKHLQNTKDSMHPLTTKVRVTAKLSIRNDPHLAWEATNYQRFPKHFFEHWSGYNILPPLDDPTPVGPLVPQFYGYYVPKQCDNAKRYFSPILLIEYCGTPIPRILSIDDKHECVALALRLHSEANQWFHGSFYRRNILRKPGPLSAHPNEREVNRSKRDNYGADWSFRLIDFGRSDATIPIGLSPMYRLDRERKTVLSWYKGVCELDE